jgi:Skp family chaperone for outer membrane proteins
MKKHILYYCLATIFLLTVTQTTNAQVTAPATTSNVVLDAKTQAKVDKIRVDLAKNQQKLNKEMASYEKSKMKYDKDINAGKLSPKDKAKAEQKLSKANLSIGKLKQKIAKNEEDLAKYNL